MPSLTSATHLLMPARWQVGLVHTLSECVSKTEQSMSATPYKMYTWGRGRAKEAGAKGPDVPNQTSVKLELQQHESNSHQKRYTRQTVLDTKESRLASVRMAR